VRVFANGRDAGNGVVLATTENSTNLFASSFDGDSFTPLVEIRGENQDDGAPVDLETTSVCFTNDVAGRDGDAIILYRRQETGTTLDTNGNNVPEDDNNVRLYSCYFDVSQSQDAVSIADDGATELNYGFSALATFVDSDPNGDDEDFDANVESFGFAFDGLCYSCEFDTGDNDHRSGDPVSFVFAVWTQSPDTNVSSGIGTRVWYSQFDLDSTSTRFPAPSTLAAPGLEDEDEAGTQLLVHNGCLAWTLDTDNGDSTDNDDFLLANVFDETGPGATARLSRADPDASDVVQTSARRAESLYGDDHGLSQYYFFFLESGFNDGTNTSAELDVMLATVDLSGSNVETEEIDEFVDGTGLDVAPVYASTMSTALGRGGEVIVAAWQQNDLSSEEAVALNVSSTRSLFVRGVDTSITSGIADALTGDIGQNHTATRLNDDVRDAPDEVSREVFGSEFQEELADGTTSPDAAIQSNRFKVHLLFEQNLIDLAPTNISTDRVALHLAFVEFDTTMTPPTFTTGSGTASDTIVDTVDWNWSFISGDPLLQTNGGASAVDDGEGGAIVLYLNQGNNKDDASAPGSGGGPTTVPALQLEIPLSAPGAPSFQVGDIIALDRIENYVVVSNEPGCAVTHVHSLTDLVFGRVIFIDGQGPYTEPAARQPVCGYGPEVQLTITPPGGGSPLAAFRETRLFFWLDGQSVEISSDGSAFGTGTGSPDFFQVHDFKVATTPTDTDVTNRPDFGGDTLHVVFREHNSNRGPLLTGNGNGGSPLVLRARTFNKTSTDPDPGNRFDPPLDRFPERVDTGQPSYVEDVVCEADGDTVALYFLSNERLYYNEWNGQSWRTADGLPNPALVDHDSERPIDFFVIGDSRLCTGDSTLAGVPILWIKRDPDSNSPRRLRARIHR
jgi:hypothetical protein